MGLFLSSRCFWFLLRVLCSEREGRSPSRRLRSGSRSARKGSRDRNASAAWRLAALASLVFRSALTPEHAWFDVRTFGHVFALTGKKSGGKNKAQPGEADEDDANGVSIPVRGPVTIQSAFSVEPGSITST